MCESRFGRATCSFDPDLDYRVAQRRLRQPPRRLRARQKGDPGPGKHWRVRQRTDVAFRGVHCPHTGRAVSGPLEAQASGRSGTNEPSSVSHEWPTRPPRNNLALVSLYVPSEPFAVRTGMPCITHRKKRRRIGDPGQPTNSTIQRRAIRPQGVGDATACSRPALDTCSMRPLR